MADHSPALHRGKFVGGCDIIREMNGSGDLQKLLGVEAAAEARSRASPSDRARPKHSRRRRPKRAAMCCIFRSTHSSTATSSSGRASRVTSKSPPTPCPSSSTEPRLKRANGVSIDFVDGPGGGFKIENPNEPPRVKGLAPAEAKAMVERGELTLFDVRSAPERAMATIAVARPLDAAGQRI